MTGKTGIPIYARILGLVGANGAGKNTLLKLISRALKPTQGGVSVRARVTPLLVMGIGFIMELSRRENSFGNHAPTGALHS